MTRRRPVHRECGGAGEIIRGRAQNAAPPRISCCTQFTKGRYVSHAGGGSARIPPADPIGLEFENINMTEKLNHIRRIAEEKGMGLPRRAGCGLRLQFLEFEGVYRGLFHLPVAREENTD